MKNIKLKISYKALLAACALSSFVYTDALDSKVNVTSESKAFSHVRSTGRLNFGKQRPRRPAALQPVVLKTAASKTATPQVTGLDEQKVMPAPEKAEVEEPVEKVEPNPNNKETKAPENPSVTTEEQGRQAPPEPIVPDFEGEAWRLASNLIEGTPGEATEPLSVASPQWEKWEFDAVLRDLDEGRRKELWAQANGSPLIIDNIKKRSGEIKCVIAKCRAEKKELNTDVLVNLFNMNEKDYRNELQKIRGPLPGELPEFVMGLLALEGECFARDKGFVDKVLSKINELREQGSNLTKDSNPVDISTAVYNLDADKLNAVIGYVNSILNRAAERGSYNTINGQKVWAGTGVRTIKFDGLKTVDECKEVVRHCELFKEKTGIGLADDADRVAYFATDMLLDVSSVDGVRHLDWYKRSSPEFNSTMSLMRREIDGKSKAPQYNAPLILSRLKAAYDGFLAQKKEEIRDRFIHEGVNPKVFDAWLWDFPEGTSTTLANEVTKILCENAQYIKNIINEYHKVSFEHKKSILMLGVIQATTGKEVFNKVIANMCDDIVAYKKLNKFVNDLPKLASVFLTIGNVFPLFKNFYGKGTKSRGYSYDSLKAIVDEVQHLFSTAGVQVSDDYDIPAYIDALKVMDWREKDEFRKKTGISIMDRKINELRKGLDY